MSGSRMFISVIVHDNKYAPFTKDVTDQEKLEIKKTRKPVHHTISKRIINISAVSRIQYAGTLQQKYVKLY